VEEANSSTNVESDVSQASDLEVFSSFIYTTYRKEFVQKFNSLFAEETTIIMYLTIASNSNFVQSYKISQAS
jgi:hypothetical protein